MKKMMMLCLVTVILLCSSCGKKEKPIEPELSQMKSICELATMDCYYHNVAKYSEKDAQGILWWKKDKKFWIEYDGVVTIGVDASLVNITVKDDKVTITMPSAEVLGCKVDEKTLNENSFVVEKGSADVNAVDQTEAFKLAQKNIKESALKDTVLLKNAQQRAQKLLEDYVHNIGEAVGKEYQIQWKYVDAKQS